MIGASRDTFYVHIGITLIEGGGGVGGVEAIEVQYITSGLLSPIMQWGTNI